MKPRLLDLFCGAGGMTRGFQEAGFHVIGVDREPQPNYCGDEFVQGDALATGHRLLTSRRFDAVAASPPCQAHSDLQKQSKIYYSDLIPPVRELLRNSGLPYVIENVEGAKLIDPVLFCGTMFPGLRVIRHRLFETNWPLEAPPHPDRHPPVFTFDKRKSHYGKLDQDTSFVQVTGGGNCSVANKLDAMGIDWMNGREVNQAIPPAYARHIGAQLRAYLRERPGATLTTREKQAILSGKHPALSRDEKTFEKGEVIAIRTLRSLAGPVPVVSITITNVKKKDDVYLPEYTIRDDRALYLKRGSGYTRALEQALDQEAPILDPEVIEEYAMEAQAKTALQSAERTAEQKAGRSEAKAGRGKQAAEAAIRQRERLGSA